MASQNKPGVGKRLASRDQSASHPPGSLIAQEYHQLATDDERRPSDRWVSLAVGESVEVTRLALMEPPMLPDS